MTQFGSFNEAVPQINGYFSTKEEKRLGSRVSPKITTIEFKEKLNSLSKERVQSNERCKEELERTQKKQTFEVDNEEFYQRSRTETEQPGSRRSFHRIFDHEKSVVTNFFKRKRNGPATLESKIDLLVSQVSRLNKKSE